MRRLAVTLLSLAAMLALPAAAGAFEPATQSHPGACSRETSNVSEAVHDYAANGVLGAFAHLIHVSGSGKALERKMAAQIRLARVQQSVVTENHGCDGEGGWFAVGARKLNAGERVGVNIPAKLLDRLCGHRSATCAPVTWTAHVVFPTNCWNPNFGAVKVSVDVRRERKRHKRVVKHFEESKPPAPVIASPPPASPPLAAPSATAAVQSCAIGGGVDVTLANASTATGPASFVLEWTAASGATEVKAYGPVSPGATQTVVIPLTTGSSTTLTVISGNSALISAQRLTNHCGAEPAASAAERCGFSEGPVSELLVELSNGAEAMRPASFLVEFSVPQGAPETAEYGPIAPGEKALETLKLIPYAPTFVKISSGTQVLLEREYQPCFLGG